MSCVQSPFGRCSQNIAHITQLGPFLLPQPLPLPAHVLLAGARYNGPHDIIIQYSVCTPAASACMINPCTCKMYPPQVTQDYAMRHPLHAAALYQARRRVALLSSRLHTAGRRAARLWLPKFYHGHEKGVPRTLLTVANEESFTLRALTLSVHRQAENCIEALYLRSFSACLSA